MESFVTDTHGLMWHLTDSPRLGREASNVFDACDRGECVIYIPIICLVEIVYLQEKGKIPLHSKEMLDDAIKNQNTGLIPMPLTTEIVGAPSEISRDDIPDMPDRIIAATAHFLDAPLLTKDSHIQRSGLRTVW